jgi:hypothetical protein
LLVELVLIDFLEYNGECIWIPDDDIKAAERMAKSLERIKKQGSEDKCRKMNKQRMRSK